MHNGCKCFHHGFRMVVSWLVILTAIGFVYVVYTGNTLWGMDYENMFQITVILALIGLGTSACRCCCGNACCGTCPVDQKKN
ncbi:MAG: hypothetical protein UU67_C0069G0005 [Candidatus Daviesbacteria bacterium GW2011_GWB1_41_5]|uniref:Uncharacterized protein n=3 Tax=Patescibacteria group TaxID=1783273 RepID=A0A0G0ZF28_9BACT|nr:MAG: hypothetical protein UU67_C0069G0005 [Candidatus Daviesbacteria bacterium GW2011_GWB1_41_5]